MFGDDPDSISSVRGIDGASWNNKRPCGVAFTFQVKKHLVEPQRDVTSNIFANNKSGSFLLNKLKHCRPEVAIVFNAFLLAGE